MTLTRLDIEAIRKSNDGGLGSDAEYVSHITNEREREECLSKPKRLGIL